MKTTKKTARFALNSTWKLILFLTLIFFIGKYLGSR